MSRLANLISTWFGCGRVAVRARDGRLGRRAGDRDRAAPVCRLRLVALPLMAALLFYPAVAAATVTAREAGIKDPGFVVVDEVIGQWITLAGARHYNWRSYLAAFVLFRLFDIWKPPPVRQLEALPGGLGINADDVMAGIYAALVLFAAGYFNL